MRFLLGLLMLVISGSALATIDVMQFKDEAQEQQFRQLTEQLRCPKCQNNSIADSNAMIAADMRLKVYELMKQGQSRQQIIDYMVARYGNFVTYEPPVTPSTDSSGSPVRPMSPRVNCGLEGRPRRRAISSIDSVRSMPRICPPGYRAASSVARSPVPQARSTSMGAGHAGSASTRRWATSSPWWPPPPRSCSYRPSL